MSGSLSTLEFAQLLGNANRLQVVAWLADPVAHFPAQVYGDLVRDGVCLGAIARKLGVAQPTVTRHMRSLTDAGLVHATRIGTWVFFRLDADAYHRGCAELAGVVTPSAVG